MKYFGEGVSEKHKALRQIIYKKEKCEQAKQLFLDIHAKMHVSKVSYTQFNEVDILLNDLQREEYAMMPTKQDETIAWILWHISRIEDITMNILVARSKQVFNEQWQEKMNISISDTGNAMSDDEIMMLSHQMDIDALLAYRFAVAKRTREIVKELSDNDMKRRVDPSDLQRIADEKGVINHPDSLWLLDFWGEKDVGGLLLMPATRHQMLHLNDCCRIKTLIRSKKRFYRQ